jgi:hypothetical protein
MPGVKDFALGIFCFQRLGRELGVEMPLVSLPGLAGLGCYAFLMLEPNTHWARNF